MRSRPITLMKLPFTGKLCQGRRLLQLLSNLEEKNLSREFCNATGSHKLKPLAACKYRNPRCVKLVNPITSPVIYRNQSNMWTTHEIFAEWFHKYFVLSVKDHLAKLSV